VGANTTGTFDIGGRAVTFAPSANNDIKGRLVVQGGGSLDLGKTPGFGAVPSQATIAAGGPFGSLEIAAGTNVIFEGAGKGGAININASSKIDGNLIIQATRNTANSGNASGTRVNFSSPMT
jgi:hypothetical protein